MVPTLIVLALLVLGVAIVAYATRRRPKEGERLPIETDTAWNDEFTPAGKPSAPAEPVRPSVTPVERI